MSGGGNSSGGRVNKPTKSNFLNILIEDIRKKFPIFELNNEKNFLTILPLLFNSKNITSLTKLGL